MRGEGLLRRPHPRRQGRPHLPDRVRADRNRHQVTGGTTVTVDVRDTYDTTFLGIIGITSMTVTGHGQARITRSVGGVEQ